MGAVTPGDLRRDDLVRRTLDEEWYRLDGFQGLVQLQEVSHASQARSWWEVVESSPRLPTGNNQWAYDVLHQARVRYGEICDIRSIQSGGRPHRTPERAPPNDDYGDW